jgi:hypothetical protein
MAILTRTTLILGAGSSVHCGFPLGMQLINDIARTRNPGRSLSLPPGWRQDDVDAFITRLSRSGHYSIDAFLETAPESMEIGKFLIASKLKMLEEVDRLFPPNDSGWYQYLFNCLANDSEQSFDQNQLSVVTFNYDRSLEAYLFHALKARFRMEDGVALKELQKIPIIHVHGSLGAFPQVSYEPIENPDALLEVSKSIKIISEIRDMGESFCNDEFREAHDTINESQKVFFLGFGFHAENIRRLKIDWSIFADREVKSTFADTSPEEYQRILGRLAPFGISNKVLARETYPCNLFFRYQASLE